MLKIYIDISTFLLEYSRIQDGRREALSCELYQAECEYYCTKNGDTVLYYLGMSETCRIFLLN